MMLTFRPDRASWFPTEEVSYAGDHVPREGDYVHLHEQGRLARVSRPPVFMVTERGMTGAIITVTGTDPDREILY